MPDNPDGTVTQSYRAIAVLEYVGEHAPIAPPAIKIIAPIAWGVMAIANDGKEWLQSGIRLDKAAAELDASRYTPGCRPRVVGLGVVTSSPAKIAPLPLPIPLPLPPLRKV
jgi:hypothetical protein